MPAVTAEEVVPGLVVHLDPSVLRGIDDVQTNAADQPVDRGVTDKHYFLILSVDGDDIATATPLFSHYSSGSYELNDGLKDGLASKWIGTPSYYSQWQLWRFPTSAVAAASGTEESTTANRRTYGRGDPPILEAILRNAAKNKYGWRKA